MDLIKHDAQFHQVLYRGVTISVMRVPGGTVTLTFTRNSPYTCFSIHFKDLEEASEAFTALSRFTGCLVTNPYEEAEHYKDSEV